MSGDVAESESDVPAGAASDVPPTGPGARMRLQRFFLLLMAFVLIGPPVGSMVLFTLTAAAQVRKLEDVPYVFMAPFVGLLFSPLSYMFGILPAVFGGLIVAGWQSFCGRVSAVGILAIGTVLGLAFVHVSDGLGALVQKTVDWKSVANAFLTTLLPSVICWYPFRKRYYPPPGSPLPAQDAKT